MASSACRSAAFAAIRTAASRSSRSSLPKPSPSRRAATRLFSSRPIPIAAAAVGITESLMPLHSAIASARLRSSIAADSSRWSWLSQGLKRDF